MDDVGHGALRAGACSIRGSSRVGVVDVRQPASIEKLTKAQGDIYQFTAFINRNPQVMDALIIKARELSFRRGHVSCNYLIEWLRYDADIMLELPRDQMNRRWRIPNIWATILARYLVREEPSLKAFVELNESTFDDPRLFWPELRSRAVVA